MHRVITKELVEGNNEILSNLLPSWMENARQNIPILSKLSQERLDLSILSWPDRAFQGKDPSCFACIGSGSSLTYSIQDLKDFPGVILCSATNFPWLIRNTIIPQGILIVDKAPFLYDLLKPYEDLIRKESISILATPFVHPGILSLPRKDCVFFFFPFIDQAEWKQCPQCGHVEAFAYAPPETFWFNALQRYLFPFWTAYVLQAGSVSSVMPQILTRLYVGADVRVSPDPHKEDSWKFLSKRISPKVNLYLYGFDFSFNASRESSLFYSRCPRPDSSPHSRPILSSPLLWHVSLDGKVFRLTEQVQLVYKRSFYAFLFLSQELYPLYPVVVHPESCPLDSGILEELPHVSSWKDSPDTSVQYLNIPFESRYKTYLRSSPEKGIPEDFKELSQEDQNRIQDLLRPFPWNG